METNREKKSANKTYDSKSIRWRKSMGFRGAKTNWSYKPAEKDSALENREPKSASNTLDLYWQKLKKSIRFDKKKSEQSTKIFQTGRNKFSRQRNGIRWKKKTKRKTSIWTRD